MCIYTYINVFHNAANLLVKSYLDNNGLKFVTKYFCVGRVRYGEERVKIY